jgi:PAS domain S-box-containing protein
MMLADGAASSAMPDEVSPTIDSFWNDLVACGGELDRVLDLIVRRVVDLVGEGCVLTVVSDDGMRLDPVAWHHPAPEIVERMGELFGASPVMIGEGLAGTVAQRREPIAVTDLNLSSAADMGPLLRLWVQEHPIRSIAVVPLIAYGELQGTLGAVRLEQPAPYSPSDIVVLETLAERASMAIADARRKPEQLDPANYEAIFRYSLDGVLFTMPDGRVLAANPAACDILGRTEVEICRLGRYGLLDPDDARIGAAVARRQATGSARTEARMIRGDGTLVTVELSSTIFSTSAGEIRACVLFRDVTERVEATQRLSAAKDAAEAANQAKSTFLATMSHELRTPLNSVIGFAQLLRADRAGVLGEKERAYAERIVANGTHLLALIDDVLDLSKVEAGRSEPVYSDVDVMALCDDVIEQFLPQVEENGSTISLVGGGEVLLPVRADDLRLRQILVNLIGNAVKFTQDGHVAVRLLHDGALLLGVDIEDTGIGIEPDKLDMIWEPFRQADESTARSYAGTGLGLALVRSMATSMGFTVAVDSTVGSGSTFSVRL